jgi:hypothetical protein
MNRYMVQGIVIGVVLGLLVGFFFVWYFAGDWSWLIFGGTLGVGLGIGIGMQLDPTRQRRKASDK